MQQLQKRDGTIILTQKHSIRVTVVQNIMFYHRYVVFPPYTSSYLDCTIVIFILTILL